MQTDRLGAMCPGAKRRRADNSGTEGHGGTAAPAAVLNGPLASLEAESLEEAVVEVGAAAILIAQCPWPQRPHCLCKRCPVPLKQGHRHHLAHHAALLHHLWTQWKCWESIPLAARIRRECQKTQSKHGARKLALQHAAAHTWVTFRYVSIGTECSFLMCGWAFLNGSQSSSSYLATISAGGVFANF